jgi:hypothetical protein
MIDGVKNVDRASASDCHDRDPDLSPERSAVGQSDKASSVDQSLQLGSYICEEGWGAENNCIGRVDLFQVIVHTILLHGAPIVPILEALQAGDAPPAQVFRQSASTPCSSRQLPGFEHLLEHDLRIAA